MIRVLFEQQCLRIVYQWLHVCKRHILQRVLHIFSLLWSGGLVVLQVCWLTSPLCDSFPIDPTLTWTLPVTCTSRGLMLLGLGARCLPLFKGRANMIPAFRCCNMDGSHLLVERRSAGWGGTAVVKAGSGQGWGRVVLVVLILSWNVPVRHQPWRSSSQLLFSSAGLLPAAGLAEPGPRGVDFSLRRAKGCVHLFRKGHGQRYFLCTVTRKPHHQSGFALRSLQKKSLVCAALFSLLCRGWVMPVHVTQ